MAHGALARDEPTRVHGPARSFDTTSEEAVSLRIELSTPKASTLRSTNELRDLMPYVHGFDKNPSGSGALGNHFPIPQE